MIEQSLVDAPRYGAEDHKLLHGIGSLATYFAKEAAGGPLPLDDTDWLRVKANRILGDRAGEPRCLFNFGKKWLAERLLFGPAVKVYELALSKDKRTDSVFSNQLLQQKALATYKNEEAPTRRRLQDALEQVQAIRSLLTSDADADDAALSDATETKALEGAVFRRMWDLDGKVQLLQRALASYRAADAFDNRRGDVKFDGYGALNAGFLLDALSAHLDSVGEGPILHTASAKARDEAWHTRKRIVRRLERRLDRVPTDRSSDWICETLAGAYLGLGLARRSMTAEQAASGDEKRSDAELLELAARWAEAAFGLKHAEWQREATYAQWLRLAWLNEPRGAPVGDIREYWEAVGGVVASFRQHGGVQEGMPWEDLAGEARRGKVGLALSGGGLRASFYHLGVLARLAEVDALRHVDALSTVSGGSIVGAHYYLLLRKLLQAKEHPTREDYLDLVAKLQQQFSVGTDRNLRMLGLSNAWVTLKLLFARHYTRSDRMAELYDSELFAHAQGASSRRVPMSTLKIIPKGESASFNPRYSNWRRFARVPALLINATCLNTGHSWQFTANWMGEPPELIGENIDKNERLRRVPYRDAGPNRDLSLGFAVAASACVPGIFEPLRLSGLYPGRLVRLVDGGVHDNQGIDALLGLGCDFILCSDGSGQMGDQRSPPNGPVGTPKRSMDILMKRVREGEHGDIENRVLTGTRRGLFFVHLKHHLPVHDIDWDGCDDPTHPPVPRVDTTPYNVDNEMQRMLSDTRTDLDSFSEVEANALMASGYLMTHAELTRLNADERAQGRVLGWGGLRTDLSNDRTRWTFLELEDLLAMSHDAGNIRRDDLARQLHVARNLFFKELLLADWLKWLLACALLASLLLVAWGARNWEQVLAVLRDGAVTIRIGYVPAMAVLVGTLAASSLPRLRVWCVESFFAVFGLIASNAYFLLGFNRLFLMRGRLLRLLRLK